MSILESLEQENLSENKKWISVSSELVGLDGQKKDLKIALMTDGKPKAMAFFDIDGTLAHLSVIHGRAIQRLFPEQDPVELEDTYYKGFKLGNSFREFDRMRGIYVDGHIEWKDPEVYLRDRFSSHEKEIDEAGHEAHDVAAAILKKYGEIAGEICDLVYQNEKDEFTKSNIQSIFLLARIYSRLGIPIVGFTANSKIFVEKLAKYLGLADIFLDIATDEDMVGGGKEIAILHLLRVVEGKGIPVPKDRLIFVGDSLRGDIGISLIARKGDKDISGQGVLVLKDKAELIQIKKQISGDHKLKALVDSMDIHGLVVADVPLDERGEPMLLDRFSQKFLEKL